MFGRLSRSLRCVSTVSPRRREAAPRSEPIARARCKLADEYPESVHVAEIGLGTATDREIWEYAGERDDVIVSEDSDFRQLALLFGPPHVGS